MSEAPANRVRLRDGGSGPPYLLLLHGLGATGEVWRGVHDVLPPAWPGGWLAPDLPGHGGSARLPRYSVGALAAAVAAAVVEATGDAEAPTVVLGHSLGGAVALALASGWFGMRVDAACGLGVKALWTDAELAAARSRAARPARRFGSREQAVERHLAVAGLTGLWNPDDPACGAGVVRVGDAWEETLDPAAFGVGAPHVPGLLAAARAPVVLAAGEHDPMCPAGVLRGHDAHARVLTGLGHNAHVEDPQSLRPILGWLAGHVLADR